jgi:hypothetical protein
MSLYNVLDNYSQVCSARGLHEQAQELRTWAIHLLSETHGHQSNIVDNEKQKLVSSVIAQVSLFAADHWAVWYHIAYFDQDAWQCMAAFIPVNLL